MSDIARIKFGFKIESFFVSGTVDPYDLNLFIEKNRELEESLLKIYEIQDRKIISQDRINSFVDKVMRIVERNGNEVGFGSKDDVEYRIKLINRFWKLNLNNSSFEKMQLFNSYYKIVFSDYDEYQTKCYNVYSVVDGNVCIYKLIAIEINDSFYYYLDDGKEFKEYSVKELLFEFTKRNVRIKDYIEIIGINSGLDTFKLKK